MRGAVAGLATPYPLGTLMPAVFQEDPVAMQWTAGLDDVIAPVVSTLDCIAAYVDPLLAPADFVSWLSGWLGMALNENWPLDRRRAIVAHAVGLYRSRGTAAGLRALLELVTAAEVEIAESGGVAWSQAPNSPLPGEDRPRVEVRLIVAARAGRAEDTAGAPWDGAVDTKALDELIAAEQPAHVTHRLEVVER